MSLKQKIPSGRFISTLEDRCLFFSLQLPLLVPLVEDFAPLGFADRLASRLAFVKPLLFALVVTLLHAGDVIELAVLKPPLVGHDQLLLLLWQATTRDCGVIGGHDAP